MPGQDNPFEPRIYRGPGAYGEARRAQESQPYGGPLTPERLQGKQGERELETPVPGAQRWLYDWFFSEHMGDPRKRQIRERIARDLFERSIQGVERG